MCVHKHAFGFSAHQNRIATNRRFPLCLLQRPLDGHVKTHQLSVQALFFALYTTTDGPQSVWSISCKGWWWWEEADLMAFAKWLLTILDRIKVLDGKILYELWKVWMNGGLWKGTWIISYIAIKSCSHLPLRHVDFTTAFAPVPVYINEWGRELMKMHLIFDPWSVPIKGQVACNLSL